MFTVEQLQDAHHKVQSGEGFPAYIREIRELGVTHYEAYVSDGHMDYHDDDGYTVTTPPRYAAIRLSQQAEPDQFRAILKAHQQGKSSFDTFIQQCAGSGVACWKIDIARMTCTYFDLAGNELLVETIPG